MDENGLLDNLSDETLTKRQLVQIAKSARRMAYGWMIVTVVTVILSAIVNL